MPHLYEKAPSCQVGAPYFLYDFSVGASEVTSMSEVPWILRLASGLAGERRDAQPDFCSPLSGSWILRLASGLALGWRLDQPESP